MASPYRKRGTWYLRWKDDAGRWRGKACGARTKTEARQLQAQLERRDERVRLGIEPGMPEDGGGTLAELLRWWLDTYSRPLASHKTNESAIRVHFLGSDLASLPLTAVTPGRVELFLQQKLSQVSPQMVNHLRGYLGRAFNAARRAGRYPGPNPVLDVRKRRVPKRKPDFLRVHEIPLLLRALDPRWRPLFAAAIYTGLRKGELLALRKGDVDLDRQVLVVRSSHERATTKGGHAEGIPIATELVPFLEVAIARSPSALVFPKPDGSMMRRDVNLEERDELGRDGDALGVSALRRGALRSSCGRRGPGGRGPRPPSGGRGAPPCGGPCESRPRTAAASADRGPGGGGSRRRGDQGLPLRNPPLSDVEDRVLPRVPAGAPRGVEGAPEIAAEMVHHLRRDLAQLLLQEQLHAPGRHGRERQGGQVRPEEVDANSALVRLVRRERPRVGVEPPRRSSASVPPPSSGIPGSMPSRTRSSRRSSCAWSCRASVLVRAPQALPRQRPASSFHRRYHVPRFRYGDAMMPPPRCRPPQRPVAALDSAVDPSANSRMRSGTNRTSPPTLRYGSRPASAFW